MHKLITSILISGLAIFLVGAQNSLAGEQCSNPKPGYPALSFGMTGIGGSQCKSQLDRARWLGFTSVSLSPTFYLGSNGSVAPKENPADFISCLNSAKDLGFDIIYKPMIETPNQPIGNANAATPKNPTLGDKLLETSDQSKAVWRAWLDFKPGSDYEQKVMEPFLTWMENNQVKGSALKASVVVATEMHRSIVDHPAEWNSLMWGMRKRLEGDGLRNQVQIGIDPSTFGRELWLPSELRRGLSKSDCEQYQAMLWTADFYAGSVYGDYMAAGFKDNPTAAIQKMSDEVESRWKNSLWMRGCHVTKGLVNRYENAEFNGRDKNRATKVTWSGEIGYGGSLTHSYSGFETDPPYSHPDKMNEYKQTTLIAEQKEFQQNAPIWLKAVLDHARGSNQDSVNFWITGRFDIFGMGDFPPLADLNSTEGQYTSKDPVRGADQIPAIAQIRDLMQDYTRDRCPGWQPKLPFVVVSKKLAAGKPAKKKEVHHRPLAKKIVRAKPIQVPGTCITVTSTIEQIVPESSDFEGLIDAIDEETLPPMTPPDLTANNSPAKPDKATIIRSN